MVFEGFAAALALAFAVYDAYFSVKRIRKYGLNVELNTRVGWLYEHLGAPGVYTYTTGLTALFMAPALFGAPGFVWFALGIRACLFDFQQNSIRLETEIAELLKSGQGQVPPLPALNRTKGA